MEQRYLGGINYFVIVIAEKTGIEIVASGSSERKSSLRKCIS